ncbi:hypothetical protein PCNPT3_05005 [Psychromonas sp. CNPT3]|uniref:EexN family lipoprotein n=1 Tax=Psychromonas sp. CNPT3 TaxID=314282 RepID=UPI00006E48AF|nr:EexN family lipoprotein [Psychromonas sp. CNPT3]AGH80943.1 hypothetical protein PCNPT3_05005 [Psychromonas sp. CNPT3]
MINIIKLMSVGFLFLTLSACFNDTTYSVRYYVEHEEETFETIYKGCEGLSRKNCDNAKKAASEIQNLKTFGRYSKNYLKYEQ